MKLKTRLFLLFFAAMVVYQIHYSKVHAETMVLFKGTLNVPVPDKTKQGIEKPFTLDRESTVTLTITKKKQKSSLNVYLLDADNYSKYQTSGSLANLDFLSPFTQLNTSAFEITGDLAAGKYVLIIQWAHAGVFRKTPAVGLKLIAEEQAEPTPTPIPKDFWSRLISEGN